MSAFRTCRVRIRCRLDLDRHQSRASSPSQPSRASRRQVDSCPPDSPCRRAVAEISPGLAKLSATIRRFSSKVHRRRAPVNMTSMRDTFGIVVNHLIARRPWPEGDNHDASFFLEHCERDTIGAGGRAAVTQAGQVSSSRPRREPAEPSFDTGGPGSSRQCCIELGRKASRTRRR